MTRVPCALFLLLVFAATRAEGQQPEGKVQPVPDHIVRKHVFDKLIEDAKFEKDMEKWRK
jgi:hypothetical protein